MKKKNLIKTFCLAALAMLQLLSPAQAQDRIGEDIYLFSVPKTSSNDLPNVLFVVDNTANWTSPFEVEKAALAAAFKALPADQFRVGLMMFTETGSGDSNVDGSYIRAAIRTMDKNTQGKYSDLITSLNVNGDKSNGGKAGKAMVEVYRYLTGGAPYAGNNKNKTDYTNNVSGTAESNAIYKLDGNALTSKAGTAYTPPAANGCRGIYVIYLSNGPVQDNTSDSAAAASELTKAGAGQTPTGGGSWTSSIPLVPSGSQDNVADEWARFMYQTMGVTFFTIDVVPKATGQTAGWSALLRSMAKEGNGTYYDLSKSSGGTTDTLAKDLGDALSDIMSKIQSVNSAFSSVSLPVSVNTQGTYLNQVYMGMFRPDINARPRWYGNLKQYKVGVDAQNNPYLADARDPALKAGNNAVDSSTGFITNCSLSYWTPTTADTYWSFAPSANETSCYPDLTSGANSSQSNSPDGPNVEKGAQAYMLRSIPTADRKMLTCTSDTCPTTLGSSSKLDPFAATNGAILSKDANRTTLIDWARGLDNKGDERGTADKPVTSTTAMRPSVHGDVVHSRPVALNYGNDTSPQVVVFYGGNDGALHAVAGNRTAPASTNASAGSELWSFMPPEFHSRIQRLYDNSVRISYPDLVALKDDPVPQPKAYGMDGPMTAYQSANGATVWLYAAMRRGGRSIYAFDVSSMGSPKMKWRRGCDESANCTTGMEGIGQTWSSPKVFRAPGYGSGSKPLLIFGGGYDACEDNDTTFTCNTSSKGNHIYVMDADTGELLKTFDTARPVPGDITVVNAGKTGQAKIAYAADLGGNVYRIDLMGDSTKAPADWTLTKVASLGCDTVATCTPNRKFMFGPDVVEDSGAYVILVGSGDREKPLRYYTNALSVANRFYMLVDKPTDPTWLTSEGTDTKDANEAVIKPAPCGKDNFVLCQASLKNIPRSETANPPTPTDLAAYKGWYLELLPGEQVVTSSVTAYGATTFSTHVPVDPSASQVCKSQLGRAQVYNVSYLNASPTNSSGIRSQDVLTGGLSPSPVLATVKTDDGQTRNLCFGCGQRFPEPTDKTPSTTDVKQSKRRVYWYIQR